jgi:hypothetical protein
VAAVQEQFVDSPWKAVTEADALLARLAGERGFPDGEQFDEQLAALSVHHAYFVQGYRSMHTAARGQSGTEEMREAMVAARGLFEALVTEEPADPDRRRPGSEPLPQGERDKLALRLQQALSTFVDSPCQAVGEADAVFDEIATHLTNTLTEQRRVLRQSWQDPDSAVQTEEPRLALRQYREITERLPHMSAPAGQ